MAAVVDSRVFSVFLMALLAVCFLASAASAAEAPAPAPGPTSAATGVSAPISAAIFVSAMAFLFGRH